MLRVNTFISKPIDESVVLKGQCSSRSNIKAAVSQGSALGLFFILKYIEDLPEGLTTNAKDAPFFSALHDSKASLGSRNNDFPNIYQWVYQWKMIFDPEVL